jgi:hypothetical protein
MLSDRIYYYGVVVFDWRREYDGKTDDIVSPELKSLS